jgi:hypothetical protein
LGGKAGVTPLDYPETQICCRKFESVITALGILAMKINITRIILIILVTFSLCESGEIAFDSTGLAYTQLLGFELEITTINDVFKKLGETKIYISGDAGEYSKRISYYLTNYKIFITFDVTEVGGGSTIMQFILSRSISDKLFKSI